MATYTANFKKVKLFTVYLDNVLSLYRTSNIILVGYGTQVG